MRPPAQRAKRRRPPTGDGRGGRLGGSERPGPLRAHDHHASQGPDAVPRIDRGGRRRHLEDGPGGRQALPSGFRAGQGPRRRQHGRNGPGRTVRDAPSRRRRSVAVAPRFPGIAHRQRAGSCRQPHDQRGAIPPRAQLPGRHGDARRRGGAGPQRGGRQLRRQPRQQGGDPRHQRALRPDPPRPQGAGADPPLLDRRRDACPTRTTWNSPWPWPTPWPWPWRISTASRSWPRTSPRSAARTSQLRERLGVQSEIVGRSAAIRQITEEIARAAASKATLLDPRRERRGQGAGGPGGPLFQPADEERLRLPELRGAVRRPAGQRAVRPRAGGVHRGHRPQDRQVRGRRTRAR